MTHFLVDQHRLCLDLLDATDVVASPMYDKLVPNKLDSVFNRSMEYLRTHDIRGFYLFPPQRVYPGALDASPRVLDAVGVNLKWNSDLDITYQDNHTYLCYSG